LSLVGREPPLSSRHLIVSDGLGRRGVGLGEDAHLGRPARCADTPHDVLATIATFFDTCASRDNIALVLPVARIMPLKRQYAALPLRDLLPS
jgi:hypothetical protein